MHTLVKAIKSLVKFLESNRGFRWTFLLVVTLLTITIHGYHFGSFDHASHIPFLKHLADPSLYPNDHFFSLQDTHYSFFWYFFIPFVHLNLLEVSVFVVYFISIFLTFTGIWNLSKALFSNSYVAFITILLFVFPKIGFAGFPFFEFSLVNRVFVFPFLLFALTFYLQKKYIHAFVLLGIFYNIHVLWVQFVLGMFAFDILMRWRQLPKRDILVSIISFFVLASPIFFWRLQHPSPMIHVDREWYSALERGMLGINFQLFSETQPFLILTLGGLSIIGLFFVSFLYVKKRSIDTVIQNFIVAMLFMMFIGVVAYKFYPITLLVQFQLVRVGYFALLFGFLYASWAIYSIVIDKKFNAFHKLLLCINACLAVFPFTLLVNLLIIKKIKQRSMHVVVFLGSIVMLSGAVFVYTSWDIWRPGIAIYPQRTASLDVQLWAKEQTNRSDTFLAPPYLWWFYDIEWRVYSERPAVVVWSELLEVAFDPSSYPWFKESFSYVAPGALESFRGNNMENRQLVKKAYESLTVEQVLNIQQKYSVEYFVTEIGSYPFPVVYKNERFFVYQLPR